MKFLIVDAETTRQRRIRSILSSLGYKAADIEIVDDPKAAISTMRKKRFTCALVCLILPRSDGIALLKEIRETSMLKALPVILYGPNLSRDVVLEGAQLGASGFFNDPCSVSDVENVLQSAVPPQKTPA